MYISFKAGTLLISTRFNDIRHKMIPEEKKIVEAKMLKGERELKLYYLIHTFPTLRLDTM